jgi:hypothetical protein
MNKTISFSFLIIIINFLLSYSAQDVLIVKDAGAYERKSITYMNALWLIDQSARNLPPDKVEYILAKIKNAVFLSRFDFNPIPDVFVNEFVSQANNIEISGYENTQYILDSIAGILERTIIPQILTVIDINKEIRAANLRSEQQKNSFITDKAKSLGITTQDLEKVMNSAYIFIPSIGNFSSQIKKDSMYEISFDIGLIWYKIIHEEQNTKAKLLVKKFVNTFSTSKKDENYLTKEGMLDYKEYAFRDAVKDAALKLTVATQEIPDFRLSGQIIESGFFNAGINLGKKEGINVDDKYLLIEKIETKAGKEKEKKSGWIMVSSVGDTNSPKGYKSNAIVIAGQTYIGEVLEEFPRLPIDISLGAKISPNKLTFDTNDVIFDTLYFSNSYGFNLDLLYNIGKNFGISQLFSGISLVGAWSIGGGNKGAISTNGVFHDQAKIKNIMLFQGEWFFLKKFYIRRLAIIIKPAIGYQNFNIETDKSASQDEYYSFKCANIGFSAKGGLEVALSPSINLGIIGGYQIYGENSSWEYSYKKGKDDDWTKISNISTRSIINFNGIIAQAYLVWSLPSLSFEK